MTSRAGGVITAVDFSDAAIDLGPAALAKLVATTVAEAQHDAAMRFAERAGGEPGDNSPLAERLRADAEQAFPAPDRGGIRY